METVREAEEHDVLGRAEEQYLLNMEKTKVIKKESNFSLIS